MKTTLTILASIGLLIAAPAAFAQRGLPGNSGVDEYVESAPTGDGDRPSRDISRDKGEGDGPTIGVENRRRLESIGPDGQNAADLADAGLPGSAGEEGGSAPGAGSLGAGDSGVKPGSDDRSGTSPEGRSDTSPAGLGSGQESNNSQDRKTGLGSLLSRAFGGASSSSLGVVLPLTMLAVLLAAVVSLWRRRSVRG